jgi:flagella basal body P-ring formation protein FlgA
MRFLLITLSAGSLLGAACIQVSSNTILARDLAPAVALFRSAAPEAVIGFTPAPGVPRTLSARDLLAAARQLGLQPEPGTSLPGVCVERAAHAIDAGELKRVLTDVLGATEAHLTILDFSRQPVPDGRMEFSLTSLNKPPENAPAAPVIWRGRLIYDSQRSLSIWAKVSATVERPALLATEQIAAGEIVNAAKVTVKTVEQFPLASPAPGSVSQAEGKTAVRTILAGQRIVFSALKETNDIVSGQTVRVEVVDGLAVITLDAVAESSGRKGDLVMLRNPSSGRTFRGIVENKRKVIVRSSEGDQS